MHKLINHSTHTPCLIQREVVRPEGDGRQELPPPDLVPTVGRQFEEVLARAVGGVDSNKRGERGQSIGWYTCLSIRTHTLRHLNDTANPVATKTPNQTKPH